MVILGRWVFLVSEVALYLPEYLGREETLSMKVEEKDPIPIQKWSLYSFERGGEWRYKYQAVVYLHFEPSLDA